MNKNSVESAQRMIWRMIWRRQHQVCDNFVTKKKRENNILYKGKYYDVLSLSVVVAPDESKRAEINLPCRSKQEQNQSQTWSERKLFICLPSRSLHSLAKRVSRIQPHVIQLIRWRADVQKKKEISPTPKKLLPAAAPETQRSKDLLTTQNTKSTRSYRTMWIKLDIYFSKKEEGIKFFIRNLKG